MGRCRWDMVGHPPKPPQDNPISPGGGGDRGVE
jgi:hypothetical protein